MQIFTLLPKCKVQTISKMSWIFLMCWLNTLFLICRIRNAPTPPLSLSYPLQSFKTSWHIFKERVKNLNLCYLNLIRLSWFQSNNMLQYLQFPLLVHLYLQNSKSSNTKVWVICNNSNINSMYFSVKLLLWPRIFSSLYLF